MVAAGKRLILPGKGENLMRHGNEDPGLCREAEVAVVDSHAYLEEHERGNNGEEVEDRCTHCQSPLMNHYNAHCPGTRGWLGDQ